MLKFVKLVNLEFCRIRDEFEKSQDFIYHFEMLVLELFKGKG